MPLDLLHRIAGVVMLSIGVAASDSASAATVTVLGHGVATNTSQDQGVPNPFTPHDVIHLMFSYDSDTPDLVSDPSYGRYQITSLSGWLIADGEREVFGPDGGSVIDIEVFPDFVDYGWNLRGNIRFANAALGTASLAVSLRGTEGGQLGAIFGDSLIGPPALLLPADQWYVSLQQRFGTPSVSGLGTMRLHELPATVPAPGTLGLLTFGLAGLLFARRR